MPNKKAKERKRRRIKLAIENKTYKRRLQKMQKEKRNAN